MRFSTTISLCLAMLTIAMPVCAGAAGGALEELKFKYEVERERLEKPMATLDDSYRGRLEQLEEEAAASGKLENVLAVREELKLLGKHGHVKAGGFVELQRLQGIYDTEAAKIAAERDGKLEKLLASYKQRLEVLQEDLTREKKIEEAVEAGKEIALVAAEQSKLEAAKEKDNPPPGGEEGVQFQWEGLGAARVMGDEKDPEIRGVKAAKGLSAIYMKKALPTKFLLKGECQTSGPWAGFAVGMTPRAGDFLSVYSHEGKRTRFEMVTGGSARKGLSDEKMDWKADRWTRFELARDGDTWNFKLGSDRLEFKLPEGIDGRHVGLVSYTGSSIAVRKLKLVEE